MIVLSATDISKSYGTDVILDNISFHVNQGDRIGLLGTNGAGKTTLLNILTQNDQADSGNFFISSNTSVGYLSQKDDFKPKGTVIGEVGKIYDRFRYMEEEIHILSDNIAHMAEIIHSENISLEEKNKLDIEYETALKRLGVLQDKFESDGGFSYKSEMKGILLSMAFDESYFNKEISTLSGGERSRLALACLLMRKPDLLFLDEPTNHLDIGMLKWLEQFLRNYKGTVILVSHDRYFLDQMTTKIFELQRHQITCYTGNYTAFVEKKKAKKQSELKAYNRQQEEIRRQENMIRRFKERGTENLAKRAASREKRLAHIEKIDKPIEDLGKLKINFHQEYQSGNDVLLGKNLSKSFLDDGIKRELFRNVNFDIKRGERICIVGPNGIGKTTLLKMIMGEILPTSGSIKKGHQVNFGYYDQRQEMLSNHKTVMDEIHDAYRLYKDGEIRKFLSQFLFDSEQILVEVGKLSGGERAKLALLKLMLSGANVLILDEPTNHLDIDSKEIFEEALADYEGTVIAVSHDRYFLNKIATRIFELNENGITEFIGGYDYYQEKKEEIASGKEYIKGLKDSTSSESLAAEERSFRKKIQAQERKKERERIKLEDSIHHLENEISNLEKEMCMPEVLENHIRLNELNEKVKSYKKQLDIAYQNWMELE